MRRVRFRTGMNIDHTLDEARQFDAARAHSTARGAAADEADTPRPE
jgi:hypothetical protein